jgi:hypothetical protein
MAAADNTPKNLIHTAMLTLTVMFSGGSFGLLWKDHEKIWDHEVRLTVIEKDTKKSTPPATALYEGILESETKIEKKK